MRYKRAEARGGGGGMNEEEFLRELNRINKTSARLMKIALAINVITLLLTVLRILLKQ